MIRRLALLGGTLVAVVSFSSCSTVDHLDTVASVNGADLSEDEFDGLATSENVRTLFGLDALAEPSAEYLRDVIEAWIVVETVDQLRVADAVTDEEVAAFLDTLLPEGWQDDAAGAAVVEGLARIQVGIDKGLLDVAAAQAALAEFDIDVASRFGRWDAAELNVSPLGDG